VARPARIVTRSPPNIEETNKQLAGAPPGRAEERRPEPGATPARSPYGRLRQRRVWDHLDKELIQRGPRSPNHLDNFA
jgi:hypothetical protein